MSLPQPKIALDNACSVIFNNTLYTYSADAFQALRLAPGAQWEELTQGEKVTDGVCVGSTTGTPSTSAFFVVGGVGGSAGYQGLQKYTYSTGKWETIKLSQVVTDQRVGHSAVYLNSTDSILVFAGRQDGTQGGSTQTFTIGASAPYEVLAYTSPNPPPSAIRPILLPWSASEAVMVGGTPSNRQVFLFSRERNWVDSGASLAAPLAKDTSSIKAALLTGDDGSKHLITFDMTSSPNSVKRTVLFSGPGVPVPNAAPVRRRSSRKRSESGSRERRGAAPLTLNDWPAYNSTLAPKTTRSNFCLAQGPDDTVVIAGGNTEDVLCMFDARQNCWEDAGAKLAQFRLLNTDTSSTSSLSTATSTTSTSASASTLTQTSATVSSTLVSATVTGAVAATQTPSDSAVPAVSDNSGPPLNTILGAALGGFFGLAGVLLLAYLCIKRQMRRQAHMEAGHLRRASGFSPSEKGGLAFANDSLPRMPGSPGVFRGHQSQGSQSSQSSMAILMGRSAQQQLAPVGLSRKSSNESRRDSSDSTFRAFKSTISKPIPQTVQSAPTMRPPQGSQQGREEKGVAFAASTAGPKPRNLTAGGDRPGSTRRSSGWNRYWSGGSTLNLLGFGSGNNNSNNNHNGNSNNNAAMNNSRRTTLRSEGSSRYSEPTHRMTQDSATVPPLFPAAAESRMSFSRVNAQSPTISVYNDRLKEGLSGRIETQRPVSGVSDGSVSAYSSGIPESVQEAWDPTATNQPWGAGRSLNSSFTGLYSTALTPASQGLRPSPQAPSRTPAPRQPSQAPVRDDMSWLNLGSG